MARETRVGSRQKLPTVTLTIDKFNRGLITLIDESLLPVNAATEARNLIHAMDGRWAPRWGSAYYGVTTSATIYGAATYTTDAGATHLVVASGTAIKRSTDNGATWSSCSGASITAGNKVYFLQIGSKLYISNGVDNLIRYDGTTTLLAYSGISAPGTPTATKTGLTGTTYTASYRVSAVNDVGETAASTADTETIGKIRDSWTAGTDYITVTWSKVTGATAYNVYYKDDASSNVEIYCGSVTQPSGSTVTFVDTGETALNAFVEYPSGDTTTGPKFAQMTLSGNRIWATKDPNNPWRVYWSGTGTYQGAFSEFFGGGYIDLEKGGRERPEAVAHHGDGKGGAYATVLTSDPEGLGSIWQISLDTATIGNTSFTVPTAVKIVGSVGTKASLSVAKVRNDIFFFNTRGWFSLGPRPQLLNILSTDEISSNIRPDIRAMTGSALGNVCAYYYDAKIFVSMPYGSSTNNVIYVLDTERKSWSGQWTAGAERFFEYTDTSGSNHLLAVPIGGQRLIEFAENIDGDLGVAFDTRYLSGLIPVNTDRNAFAKVRYAYVELNNPVGNINFSVLGTEKRRGFNQLRSITISDTVSSAGYSTQQFSNFQFSDTSLTPTVYSQSSVKKRIRINRLLNNIQFKITTSSRGDSYTLLALQAKGYLVPTRDPSSWRS